MSAPYSIARYLNVRAASNPSFFSDGERIAFVTDITGVPQLWQISLPSSGSDPLWPDQLTFEADRVLGASCSPTDPHVIYAADVGGNENMQLFWLDPTNSMERALTTGHERSMHIFGEWSPDGSQFVFAANRRNLGLFEVYTQSLDGEAQLIWQNEQPGFLINMTYSPDGERIALVRMNAPFSHDLIEVNRSTGAHRLLSNANQAARYSSIHYSEDGRSLLFVTDRDADFLYIARLDLESLAVETLVAPDWDTETIAVSPDHQYLAYSVNVEGSTELHLRDLSRGDTRKADLGDVPGVLASTLEFSPDSGRLAFAFTQATRTTDVFVWDVKADSVNPVTQSSHGGIPVDSFRPPELVHYPTFDEDDDGNTRQIPAWFYRPAGPSDKPLPVVVLVHGGPESQFRPSFQPMAQYYLQNGYAVFAPNVRGSTGYGKAYSHLDDVEKRMDSVADLAHAAHWLKAQPDVDGDRLAVAGGSYGGFMVLSALTTYPDLWVAGVDIVGISNFVTFLENTSDYRRSLREVEYGSLEHDREFLERISPNNHIDKIRAPLIVLHGANDPRVPVSEAEQMVEALKARGVPVEFLVFDDEGHGLVKLKNKLVAYPAIVDFLDRHISR